MDDPCDQYGQEIDFGKVKVVHDSFLLNFKLQSKYPEYYKIRTWVYILLIFKYMKIRYLIFLKEALFCQKFHFLRFFSPHRHIGHNRNTH